MRVSPTAYRRITGAALVALSVIVLTGAAVRLTGSGLGCTDWPTCDGGNVVAPLEYHALIEFINRLFTGVVSVAVVAAVGGSWFRRPRRSDLVYLSLGLVVGVAANAVLGGLTVLYELPPILVIGHFLLSMVLLWNSLLLHRRAGNNDGPRRWRFGSVVGKHATAVLLAAAVVLVTGTIVTGTGPHGGDEDVERLPFFLPDVARIHGASVIILIALTVALGVRLSKTAGAQRAADASRWLMVLMVAQGALGYIQYFNGVPVLLVAGHVLGAVLVWLGAVELFIRCREPIAGDAPTAIDLTAQWSHGGSSPDHQPVGGAVSGLRR